jgi:demethylmenaquinone methyltransferase/2-methoxy-6-polyprenyl-1,4-benzoquinol methylase
MTDNNKLFNSPQEKTRYVNTMFARIAQRYDRMNRFMSLGQDMSWRRRAIQLAAVPPGGRLLDVAVGTGDLALIALERQPTARVTGVDFTLEMMRIGRATKHHYNGAPPAIGWTGGDALHLPYPDGAFDTVVSGFMMRNVTDVAAALAEQRRVVRRGGRVVCLEMTHPTLPVWRTIYPWIFGTLMPLATSLLSGQRDAYRYLPASVANFVGADALACIMQDVGLRGVGYQTLMLGTVAIHIGVK